MLKAHQLGTYIKFSIAAAILYLVTAWIYISDSSFNEIWLLFLGNMLFASVIAVFVLRYNHNRKERASTVMMVAAGHITAVMGILISCFVCFILLLILSPDVFRVSGVDTTLQDAAPQLENGRTNGYVFVLFANAIIGNISSSSFVSILLPFAATKAQKGESEPSRI